MPWRFRRSVKVLPGVKLNFSKSGVSTTVGGRGFKKTYGHGQERTTFGLPGTGVSYTTVKNRKPRPKFSEQSRPVQVATIIIMVLILGVCVFCCIGPVVGALNGSSTASNPTPTAPALVGNAATATATPQPTATPKPKSCKYPAVDDNPYCYTFTNTGKLITNPPADFCTYFNCISSFDNGSGYVVECVNGQYSKSGGHVGVCSKQGGFKRNLYAP